MLPSHPAVLPPLYDSTASTTEDDDADSERDEDEDGTAASIASSLRSERRRRDEARAARRKVRTGRYDVTSGSASGYEKGGRLAGKQAQDWDGKRTVYPTVEGREGLGFVIEGLGGADYAALVDQAAAPRHQRTYTSDLGSGISNDSSPANSPSLPRPSPRLAVTHESAISFGNVHSPRFAAPSAYDSPATESRVRFEQQPHRPRYERSRSSNGEEGLLPEHIVFPDAAPAPDPLATPASRRISTPASSLFSTRTAPFSSPATSVAPSSRHASPTVNAPRARSPRLPAGPATMAGETMTDRAAVSSKLYFPAPPPNPRSPLATYSSPNPSVSSSTHSLVFPSRPAQKNPPRSSASPVSQHSAKLPFPSPASAASPVFPSRSRQPSAPTGPFPSRSRHRSSGSVDLPSPSSLRAPYPTAPFPPPPAHSPHARYLSPSEQVSFTPELPISPSFASTYSNLTVAEPIFPSLGAKLADDGIVRADGVHRRVSKAPWELPPGARESDEDGDELDQMMRAQRRGAVARDQAAAKDREERRKSIHAELLKQSAWPANLADLPPVPPSPLQVQDDSFQRALLEADTVKKSLGTSLLSDSLSTRRPSPIYEDPPALPTDAASETAVSLDNGMTPSSSTSSEMSLPLFPHVPSHQHLYFPPPPRKYAHAHAQAAHLGGGLSDSGEPLETLEEEAIVASGFRANGLVNAVQFAVFDGHEHGEPVRRGSVVSDSGASRYEDAEEAPNSPRGLQEVLAAPVAVMPQRRSLDDVVEEVEEQPSEPGRLPRLRLPSSSPTSSAPATPLISAFPPVPQTSPARSSPGYGRSREASAGSSIVVPPSPSQLHRVASPAPSFGSRSSATSSAAAVSYTLPRRANPTSNGFVKPKISLGKKIGSIFTGSNASSGSIGGGISSRDIVVPASLADNPLGWSTSTATPSEWDTRTSFSASTASRHGGALGLHHMASGTPISGASSAAETDDTLNGEGKENRPARSVALDDLLSRFEREEKERIKGIAQKAKVASSAEAV
ncbi:hypothetical protein JCM6882_005371 [Rhodosporidiobolus microsporus]